MKTIEISKTIVTIVFRISRKVGYGQYNIAAECSFLKTNKTFNFHTTDSVLFDKESDDIISDDDYQTMLFSRVETSLIERLTEVIEEEESYNEQD